MRVALLSLAWRALPGLASLFALASAEASTLRWQSTEVVVDAPPLAESIDAEFAFSNTGAAPVTIEDVHSSCGCTVAKLDRRTYAPGESGTIHATFTLGERVGPQEKLITVRTAEPDSTSTALVLRVNIPKLFEVSPYFVIWSAGEAPTPKSIDLRITAPDVLSLETVESRHANFTAVAQPVDGSADHVTVLVTPLRTDQPLNGAIIATLRTKDGKTRPVSLYALVRSSPGPRPSGSPST